MGHRITSALHLSFRPLGENFITTDSGQEDPLLLTHTHTHRLEETSNTMSFFVTLLTIAAMAAAAWFFGLIKFDEPSEDAAPAAASPSTAASKGAAAPSKPDETKGASSDVDASAEEDADEYINVDTAKVAQEMAEDERRAAEVTAPSSKIEEQQQNDNTDTVNDESPAVEEVLAAPDVQEQQEAKPASSSAPVEEPEPAAEPTSAPVAEEKVEVTLTVDRDAATPSPPASPPAVGDDDDSSPASPATEEEAAKDKKKKKTARRGHV